jgi:hypothetical protein
MGAGGAKTSSAGDASHDTGDHSGASTKTGGGSGANKTGT